MSVYAYTLSGVCINMSVYGYTLLGVSPLTVDLLTSSPAHTSIHMSTHYMHVYCHCTHVYKYL